MQEDSQTYDAVILHTLISHVSDPEKVLSEVVSVTKPGGIMAIFDGDYASLTFATGDINTDSAMVKAMISTAVANPYVIRELPAIICKLGLKIIKFNPHILAEVGQGLFFTSFAESYAPMAAKAAVVTQQKSDQWLNAYHCADSNNRMFASCNFFTYLVRCPE